VFAQFRGFISNLISTKVLSPGGDSSRADPTNYMKIGSIHNSSATFHSEQMYKPGHPWKLVDRVIVVSHTEATDTSSLLEIWGIKAIEWRHNHVPANSNNYYSILSICEPPPANSTPAFTPFVGKFQPFVHIKCTNGLRVK
jgi:hypothetical protein